MIGLNLSVCMLIKGITMKKMLLLLCICLLVCSCENSSELEYLRQVNGTGAAEYFGPWVSIFKDYLFWPYAIIFGLLLSRQGLFPLIGHWGITILLFLSYKIDFDPMRAFMLPYYFCMPLLFIPPIKTDKIIGVIVIGAIASLLFLCYKAWVYESFFSWIIDMAGWGIGAYLGFIGFMFITYGRCDHCGHFGLSRMGRTKRFDDAVDHFRFLNADGSDLKDMPDNGEVKNPQEVRCAHCFEPSISATNH